MRRDPHRLRRDGRRALLTVVPLLVAGGYHVAVGGSVLLPLLVVLTVAVGLVLDVSHGRRVDAEHRQAAEDGRQLWRASVTSWSLHGMAPVPRYLRIWRDLIPVEVEVTNQAMILTPPPRYRRLGVAQVTLLWPDVEGLSVTPLGHLRPDGSLSTRSVTGVEVNRRHGASINLAFDVGADPFLSLVGTTRARHI
jgi:hypothetical protein